MSATTTTMSNTASNNPNIINSAINNAPRVSTTHEAEQGGGEQGQS